MVDKWIQKAVQHPGAFKKKAQMHGLSTMQYAQMMMRPGSKADATTKRQARLAQTLSRMRKKRHG